MNLALKVYVLQGL